MRRRSIVNWIGLSIIGLHGNAQTEDLKIWDTKPALTWMTEAYPIGNGRVGGMTFGGITHEHIQFNENSLWTGDESNTGAYQALGDLFIDLSHKDTAGTYHRELDLNRAVQQISYQADGASYKREYFCSFPDQVMVLHFTADKKGAYTGIIRIKDAHGARPTIEGMTIDITGQLENGLTYDARALIKTENGSTTATSDSTLGINNADGFTIFLSAATNYSNRRSQQWRGLEPTGKIRRILTAAAAKEYEQLLSRHLYDYQSLFGRVTLKLGDTPAEEQTLPTWQRLLNYKKEADHGIEAILFQYGRYLLISSSRKGGLPANLQGLWNESNDPPWRSDYHSNITETMSPTCANIC